MNNYEVDKSKPIKVDIGCGINYYKGKNDDEIDQWIHIDFDPAEHIEIVCDWKSIPLESEVADIIHSSETLEHIPPWEELETMKEWSRILKIGGTFIGTTPSFGYSCQEFAVGRMTYDQAQANLYGDRFSYHHCHIRTFTPETLISFLEKYGFGEIDLSESPGGTLPWWLVFTCKKIRNV